MQNLDVVNRNMGVDILQYVLYYNSWQAQIGIRPPPRAAQQWWKLIKTYETYVYIHTCMYTYMYMYVYMYMYMYVYIHVDTSV